MAELRPEQIKEWLEAIAEARPNKVIPRLEKGTRVQKSLDLFYEIDNPDIDRMLGNFPEGTVPYASINTAFRGSKADTFKLFNGSSCIPFSKAFDAGVGECLEKAILVHLSAQRGRDSFLINGLLAEENGEFSVDHGYNIIFKDRKPFLVDAHNPLEGPDGKRIPYIVPVLGIESGFYDIVVPKESRNGRTYSIF